MEKTTKSAACASSIYTLLEILKRTFVDVAIKSKKLCTRISHKVKHRRRRGAKGGGL